MIRENNRSTYLVFDRTTVGRAAQVRGGRIDESTNMFCEGTPPAAILAMQEPSGTKLIVCKGDLLS